VGKTGKKLKSKQRIRSEVSVNSLGIRGVSREEEEEGYGVKVANMKRRSTCRGEIIYVQSLRRSSRGTANVTLAQHRAGNSVGASCPAPTRTCVCSNKRRVK